MHWRRARERQAAARPSHAGAAARPHTHSLTAPQNRAHAKDRLSWRRRGARRDSETQNHGAGRPRRARRRGRAAAAPSRPRRTATRGRTAAPTHNRENSESKPRRPANLSRDQSRVSEDDDDIHVIKRNGKKEVVRYDKITIRIKKLCYGFPRTSKYINEPNV